MNYFSLPVLATGWMICGSSALAEHAIHLRGIINLPELRCALLEVNHSLSQRTNGPPPTFTTTRLVKVGESFEDQTIKGAHVQFEILGIELGRETVRLRANGKDAVCGFDEPGQATGPSDNAPAKFGIHLQKVRFEDVLNLYSDFKDRTVLIHPRINWAPISLQAAARNNTDIAGTLEKAFRETGISTVTDGNKFVLMVPTTIENRIVPRSENVVATATQSSSIYLDAPVSMLIAQYGGLLERTKIGDEPFARTRVYLRTKPLTKPELFYAFDTILAWNGLQVVLVDDKAFKVAPMPNASNH